MIVRDSSLWQEASSIANTLPGSVRVGTVIGRADSSESNTVLYLVEIIAYGRRYTLTCSQLVKHGHPYDYEQYSLSPVESLKPPVVDTPIPFGSRSGEVVVVAEMPGNEGVILGCLKHPARGNLVDSKKTGYKSSFNGLKREIEEDGSYKVTFNGTLLPTAKAQLKSPVMLPPVALPDATIYNPLTAGSFYGFEKDGSYEVSDGSKILPQGIRIDKTGGSIKITSGLVTIAIDKKTQKVETSCIDYAVTAKKSFKVQSAEAEISGLTSVKIKGAKIAIGFGGIELIDSIIQLIDGIGLLVVPHHLGPCSPVAASPTWVPQIELIKAKLQLIKGSL
jgi:hypothetical protein